MDERFVEGMLMGIGIAYVLFEVANNLNDVPDDTTNVVILNWSEGKFFFIPFGFGAVGGHLFLGTKRSIWPAFDQALNGMMSVVALVGLCGIMIVLGSKIEFKKTRLVFGLLLFLGLLYGHCFWSMNLMRAIQ